LPGSLSPQDHHGVLWTHGAAIDLGAFPEDTSSNAYNVNSHGQVVGTSEDRAHMLIGVGEHAFLWESGGPIVDLNSLISPGASLQLTYAAGINDAGEIVGFGVPTGVPPEDYETQGHAYILTPCDENHPDVEGCDYSLMDADAAARENPAPGTQKPPTTALHTAHPFGRRGLSNRHFGTQTGMLPISENRTPEVEDDVVNQPVTDNVDSVLGPLPGHCHCSRRT
jgi:probable HAF family extracellular repeat protein